MKTLKKLGVLSVAKFQGVMMGAIGLILGLFLFILQRWLEGSFSAETPEAQLITSFGPVIVILFPIAYAFLGFLAGLIGAALYNWIARLIGGIEVELSDK